MSRRPFYKVIAEILGQAPQHSFFRNDKEGFQEFFYQQKQVGLPILSQVRFGQYFGPVSREVVDGFLLLNQYAAITLPAPRFDVYRIDHEFIGQIQKESRGLFTKNEIDCLSKMAREFFERF